MGTPALQPGNSITLDEYVYTPNDKKTLVFWVTQGHALVTPRRHVSSIYKLSAPEQAELWEIVGKVRALLMERFQIDSVNIGVNDGLAAGQTIAHAHVHVIPRRPGDVPDPRGGVRWIVADKARYWS